MRRNTAAAVVILVFLSMVILAGCDQSEGSGGDPSDDDSASGGDDSAGDDTDQPAADWWRTSVFMEIFVRSYQDSDSDGIGDFPGLTSRLPYLAGLGIGALWLMPIYPTPYFDSGYDVADYEAINPDYGAMDDFTDFLAVAHGLGIRVFIDGVFNHTSYDHAWFAESRSSRDNPKADWYIWGDEPLFDCNDPFNVEFGDERWTWDDQRGQYYFHRFRPEMPELNYENPEVRAAILDVVRFWLDLGVDGFRLDVANSYFEDSTACIYHPRTHVFLKEMRAVVDEYDGRALVGEVNGFPWDWLPFYGDGSDELHMVFNFALNKTFYASLYLQTPLPMSLMMQGTYERLPPGAQHTIFLSNHDFYRYYDMLLNNKAWSKLASTLLLTMPGTPFLYYGEEIGMADGTQTIVDYRDAARTPMHWDDTENAGFTDTVPWINLAPNHLTSNVKLEDADPNSLLSHYRRVIGLRNEYPALNRGAFKEVLIDSPHGCVFMRRAQGESLLVILNFAAREETFHLNLALSPWNGKTGKVRDLYTDRYLQSFTELDLTRYTVSLPSLGFAILKLEPVNDAG